MSIKAKHITTDNFKKFGKVVILSQAAPTSEDATYKFWSDLTAYEISGETEIGICTVYKQPDSKINGMERHLRTPEILIPIDGPFILPLLKENESEEQSEAFSVNVGEAVVINKSVWHGACLPVSKDESSYFVIFRRGTPAEDVEKKNINELEIIF